MSIRSKLLSQKPLIYIIIIVVGVIGIRNVRSFTRGSSTDWKTISHPLYGFSFEYPTKWQARIYEESGYRGGKEIKARIYKSTFGSLFITVRVQLKSEPTLDDVIEWGDERWSADLSNVTLQPDHINSQPIMRRRYTHNNLMLEDIYIARKNDMIIITLQSNKGDFDKYIDDFDRIIKSFSSTQ